MHRIDREPREFFGKGYFWFELDDGRLSLRSFDGIRQSLSDLVDALEASRG